MSLENDFAKIYESGMSEDDVLARVMAMSLEEFPTVTASYDDRRALISQQDEEYAASLLADRQKVARAEGFENDSRKADDHDFDSTPEPIPSTIEELRMVRLKYFEKRSY